MEWIFVSILTVKDQLELLWEEIREILIPLECSQCGCSCPQSPGNLLILLLFLVWQFQRKYPQWFPLEQYGSQERVLTFLFPTSHYFPERNQSWKPQRWKGVLSYKEEEEEDEKEKETDLLRQTRLGPSWYFHPRKMNVKQTNYLCRPTRLIQAPTTQQVLNNLCPLSWSSTKAKGIIQLFWGLPSLHSESLGVTFRKSVCTFPTETTNKLPPSGTPIIFFNEFSVPLPKLLVKTVSLPPSYLPSISPLPALHGNCGTIEMTSSGLPNESKSTWWWASESQDPPLGLHLPLLSFPSPMKPQEVGLLRIPKVIASNEHEIPRPQDIQQSKVLWPPKSSVQTPSPHSDLLPEPQRITSLMEDPKVVVSEALWSDQQQTQSPQDSDPSTPTLNASPQHLLNPQEAGSMGARCEIASMTLPEPKVSNTQHREQCQGAETPTLCLDLHTPSEPQGTGLTEESPRVITPVTCHVPAFPWFNMQEQESSCNAGPPAPVLNMNSQTELQQASPTKATKETVPDWGIMLTQSTWNPVLSSSPQAEPQGTKSEGTSDLRLASEEHLRWGVQQIHPPCILEHNIPEQKPPSQPWTSPLRALEETQKDKHHPPESFIGNIHPVVRLMTSMLQDKGAIGEAPLHTQETQDLDTNGYPWNRQLRVQVKKLEYNPGPHSLVPRPTSPGLFFPKASIQKESKLLATSSGSPNCHIPALKPTISQGVMGVLFSNYTHPQAKKAASQVVQTFHCHPPGDPQLPTPQIPDHQATKVSEPQSQSQYKNMAAAPMLCMHRRARLKGPEKPELQAPSKSQVKASSRKRDHTRKFKGRDQGGGDAGPAVSSSKEKNRSLKDKKLTNHPTTRSLMSPHEGRRRLLQATAGPELYQPSLKAEASRVLPSQHQRAGRGDEQQSRPQWDWGPWKEARKGSSSTPSSPAMRGLQKFLGGLMNSLRSSQKARSMASLQAAIKVAKKPRSGHALALTPQ